MTKQDAIDKFLAAIPFHSIPFHSIPFHAMRTRDLVISDGKNLNPDGQWHRCTVANKRGRNTDGAYRLFLEGPMPWGLYRNWTDGKDVDHWQGDAGRPLTEGERQELKRQEAEQRKEHEKEAAALAAEACANAKDIWEHADDALPDHPYLVRKKIKPHGIRVDKYNSLLVPMHAPPNNKLVNLQFITADGAKFFCRGGRAKGCYSPLDGNFDTIVIAEGFATAASINEATQHHVIVAFSAGNLTAVTKVVREKLRSKDDSFWKTHERAARDAGLAYERREVLFDAKLVIAADDDWKTKYNPGIMAALEAARIGGALITFPNFDDKERKPSDTDFNDLRVAFGSKAVADDIADTVTHYELREAWLLGDPHAAYDPPWIKDLAAFAKSDPAGYEELLAKLGTLKKEKKVRVAPLAKAVKAATEDTEDSEEEEEDSVLFSHWVVEPWPEPVETAALLQAITEQFSRYIATLEKRAIVPALWVMFTYVHDVATHSPLLLVTSPEPNSGKTTLLGVTEFLARRALSSVNISGASLFRSLVKWTPTLIVDEADTALVRNDDLKEVINSGWTRNSGVIRCHHETNEPLRYSTFAPKAIGMKGKKLPDTTLSRAITINMKRKQPNEVVQDFDHLDHDEFATLRRKLVRWAADNAEILRVAKPQTPAGFYNRLRMNWWLVLAIAELAGPGYAEEARKAAQAIEGDTDRNRTSLGVLLLTDLRELFDEEFPDPNPQDGILSRMIVQTLVQDEEKPWATYQRGKPLTQKQLANLLADYGIHSGEVNPRGRDEKHGKGYHRRQFEEAWTRYLRPAAAAAEPVTKDEKATVSDAHTASDDDAPPARRKFDMALYRRRAANRQRTPQ